MRVFQSGHARDLGLLIHLPAVLALPSMLVAILAEERFAVPGLLLMAAASLVLGQALFWLGRGRGERSPAGALSVVALAWLFTALLGAIPFLLAALLHPEPSVTLLAFRDPLNALFESMSGFTSTGLTVAQDASLLPRTLHWWRSLSQWVGALGIVLFALIFLDSAEGNYRLFSSEARERTYGHGTRGTVIRIWGVYLLLTPVVIVLYLALGMPWWEAINHGLTGIATGGFTITSNSFQAYTEPIKVATMVVIAVGALPFEGHYLLLRRGDWHFLARQSQVRAFLVLLTLGMMLLLSVNLYLSEEASLVDTLFQWVTALATCGFSTVALGGWNPVSLVLLVFAMGVGATAGSTAGGLKLNRTVWLAKGMLWQLQRAFASSNEENALTFNGESRSPDRALRSIRQAAVLASLWFALLASASIALLVLLTPEFTFHEVLFEATSALSNIGLSVGIVGPDLPAVGRGVLIVLMWLGRLEVIAVLVLIRELLTSAVSIRRGT